MVRKQFYLPSLSHASYLVGDPGSGHAAVIDPQRDVEGYADFAKAHHLTIRYAILTHFHSDFVAGHIELRNRFGAEICLGARARAGYRFGALPHGASLDLGNIRLVVLETPGHTMESISLVLYDQEISPEKPLAVFTGDILLVGDVGRPDLIGESGMSADELAGCLFDSLHNHLLTLPDDTLVYPAHGGGSYCGAIPGKELVTTIGEQRRYNHALQIQNKTEFIRRVNAYQPEAPQYFAFDAYLNRREHPDLEDVLKTESQALPLERVIQLKSDMAQIVDVRNPADFAGGHVNGSINIGLGGKFATWAGSMLDREHPIVIIAEPGREREAMVRLARVGYDNVVGYLQGGMQALNATPELVQCTKRVTACALAHALSRPDPPMVLDVRSEEEWRQRHIEPCLHIPLPHLEQRLAELPRHRQLVVYCASGYRSSIATSLLQKHGFTNVSDLIGGFDSWEEAVVTPLLQSEDPLPKS